jgi:DNA repair protein RecO (recombination protein O)
MSKYLKDQAIVLKSYALKDNDKIFVLLTKNHSIVKAVAKNIRSPKSKLKGRVMPFMLIDVMLYKGKTELYNFTEVATVTPYTSTIVKHYDFYTVSNILIEISEKINYWSSDTRQQFLLLNGALDYIYNEKGTVKTVLNAFFIKTLILAGINPNLNSCVICQKVNKNQKTINFSNYHGGVICSTCQSKSEIFVKKIPLTAIDLINLLAKSDWSNAQKYNEKTQKITLELLASFTQYQLEYKLKSLKHLNVIHKQPLA